MYYTLREDPLDLGRDSLDISHRRLTQLCPTSER